MAVPRIIPILFSFLQAKMLLGLGEFGRPFTAEPGKAGGEISFVATSSCLLFGGPSSSNHRGSSRQREKGSLYLLEGGSFCTSKTFFQGEEGNNTLGRAQPWQL